MTVLVQIAVTKYHRLGGLHSRHLLLTILEAGNSKISALADSLLGEGHHLGLVTTTFSLVLK